MPQNGLVIISIRLYNRVAFEGEGLNTLFLNRDFYGQYNILTYIESSMRLILVNNQTILATKEYWLYYYIREDFVANFYALYNTDIDLDCFGFTVVQRNTRHAIEAYLDLVNLVADSEYLTVLEYCANKGRLTINTIAISMVSFVACQLNTKLPRKCITKVFQYLLNKSQQIITIISILMFL